MGTIGVTGHRLLPDPAAMAQAVDAALDRIVALAGWDGATVVTSLAEGADRLVADRARARPGWAIEVVLPLEVDDYAADFADAASVDAYRELLDTAASVTVVGPAATREDAYLAAGLAVLRRSDVLVAVWDGLPARGVGGTADIVGRARAEGRPLVWLSTDPSTGAPAETDERLALLGHRNVPGDRP